MSASVTGSRGRTTRADPKLHENAIIFFNSGK